MENKTKSVIINFVPLVVVLQVLMIVCKSSGWAASWFVVLSPSLMLLTFTFTFWFMGIIFAAVIARLLQIGKMRIKS